MAIKVGKVNTEHAVATQREIEKGNRKYWQPEVGRNQIRIMPPPEGEEEYFHKAGFHYDIGTDKRMFPCPKMGGSRRTCFLCAESDRLQHSNDEEDQADGKSLKPTKRYLITVIDITAPADGFQVWTAGVRAFQEINYYFADPEWGDVSDLFEGFDFIINRKGQGMQTEYNVRISKKPSNFIEFLEDKLGDDYKEEMFDELPLLSEFLEYASDAEMEAAYNNISTTASREAKDDEAPRSSRRRATEEDDEDEAPARTKKAGRGSPDFPDEKKKAAAEPDDDGDEGDEAEESDDPEEEEEAAAPPRSSGRSARGTTSGRSGSRLRQGLGGKS